LLTTKRNISLEVYDWSSSPTTKRNISLEVYGWSSLPTTKRNISLEAYGWSSFPCRCEIESVLLRVRCRLWLRHVTDRKLGVYLEEIAEDDFHASFGTKPRLTFGFYAGGLTPTIGGPFLKY
jgi:hypothetical protein